MSSYPDSRGEAGAALLFAVLVLLTAFPQEATAQAPPPPQFTHLYSSGLRPAQGGFAVWADYDEDGDRDLLVGGDIGTEASPSSYTAILRNDGDYLAERPDPAGGNEPVLMPAIRFNPIALGFGDVLVQVRKSAAAWADFNGDGGLDFVVTGLSEDGPTSTWVYERVKPNGTFRLLENIGVGVTKGQVHVADFDHDGIQDILIAGFDVEGDPMVALFLNRTRSGSGFQRVETGIPPLRFANVGAGDYDNDGLPDLVISGATPTSAFVTQLWRNVGAGRFELQPLAGFEGLAYSAVAWGDFDADGDLDLLQSGGRFGSIDILAGEIQAYRNEAGLFSLESGLFKTAFQNVELRGTYQGRALWSDFNGNGLLDALVTGFTTPAIQDPGRFYYSDGTGTFQQRTDEGIDQMLHAIVEVADYDLDGDLDLVVNGEGRRGGRLAIVLRNTAPRPEFSVRGRNRAPSAPTTLTVATEAPEPGRVRFSWSPSDDDYTTTEGLTYNLRVGTTPGGNDVVASESRDDGVRLVSRAGNTGFRTDFVLEGLGPGTYYWSVQAVDSQWSASEFAQGERFDVP